MLRTAGSLKLMEEAVQRHESMSALGSARGVVVLLLCYSARSSR